MSPRGVVTFIETEGRTVVARGCGAGEEWGVVISWGQSFIWGRWTEVTAAQQGEST